MATRTRRGLGGWWWRSRWAAACLALSMTPRVGVAADISSFPEPEELAPAVRFWAATFTEYGSRDVVVHDRVQPGLVYDIVRDVGPRDDPRVQASIQAALERIERATARGPVALLMARAPTLEPLARIRTHRGMRESFVQGLTAEWLFRPAVRRALEGEGLPADLAALPLVESCYHPGLVSSAGAVGLWQLTTDVADRYLRIDGKVDERRDPARSSIAAAAHLGDLYEQFKSWPLAITAYNHGPTGIERARTASARTTSARSSRATRGPASASHRATSTRRSWRPGTCSGTRATTFPNIRPGRIVTYKVKRGDTLERVAKRHGVTIPSLRVANGIRAALIKPGQMLLVRL